MGQRVLSGDQGIHIYYLQNILRSCNSFSSEMQDGFLEFNFFISEKFIMALYLIDTVNTHI
jgi:hypothetical protein